MNFGIIGCGGIADRRTIPGMIKSNKMKIVAVEDISTAYLLVSSY